MWPHGIAVFMIRCIQVLSQPIFVATYSKLTTIEPRYTVYNINGRLYSPNQMFSFYHFGWNVISNTLVFAIWTHSIDRWIIFILVHIGKYIDVREGNKTVTSLAKYTCYMRNTIRWCSNLSKILQDSPTPTYSFPSAWCT